MLEGIISSSIIMLKIGDVNTGGGARAGIGGDGVEGGKEGREDVYFQRF